MALDKSTANPEPPMLKESEPRGKGMPPEPAQASEKTGGSTADQMLAEAKPKAKGGSTYRAPRVEPSGGPMELGYTKVKM